MAIVLSEQNLISITRQLETLLRAGVPLFRSIDILSTQSKDRNVSKLLANINKSLAEGLTLSKALEKYPKVFSAFYRSMISVGENRGELDESLLRVHNYLERTRDIRQKIISALTYPIMLVVSGILIMGGMIFLVLPKFVDIFSQSGILLPFPTRVLIKVHTLISLYGWWMLVFLIIIISGLISMRFFEKGQIQLALWQIRFPIIGEFIMSVNVSRFCRTLGVLYASGVQLLNSLTLSRSAVQNKVLQMEVDRISKAVKDGKGLAIPLLESKHFPPMMSQMIAVGEESSSLDKLLIDVSDYYEKDLDYKIRRYLSLLEPTALILISIVVAFVASAILLPLF